MTYGTDDLKRILRHLARDLESSNEPRFTFVVGCGEVDVADALRDAAEALDDLQNQVDDLEADQW